MEYVIFTIVGYLLGSIPTAYIIMKFFRKIDITKEGSQNVGAMNTFEVSNSKMLGLLVLALDFFKGFLAVFIAGFFFPDNFQLLAFTALLSVIGHCYSVWIKFKGGKGLATSAGALLFIAPAIFVIWIVLWGISFIYKRDIDFSNSAASLLTAVLSFTASKAMSRFTFPQCNDQLTFSIIISIIMLIIISKHIKLLKQYFLSSKNKVS